MQKKLIIWEDIQFIVITKYNFSIPAISIDNFIPSDALVRAAAESFEQIDDWVKYSKEDNQIQYCSKLGRENVPLSSQLVLDYIATHFNPNDIDYDANISGYSIALTDAIHAMMKAADDMLKTKFQVLFQHSIVNIYVSVHICIFAIQYIPNF